MSDTDDQKALRRAAIDYFQRFYDEETGKVSVTKMRLALEAAEAERDALIKERRTLRSMLSECAPHVRGNIGEWRILLNRAGLRTGAYLAAHERIKAGDTLLDRIDAAVKS